MTSFFQSTGLTISVSDPLVWSDRPWSDQITERLSGYEHEARSIGGYWSAKIVIKDRLEKINDWLEHGLTRHVTTYNPAGVIVWQGFVNRIKANLGPLSYVLGPVLDIGNKVAVVYSTIDTSVDPPIIGLREVTSFANDTASQERFGIIEHVQIEGGLTLTQAEQRRDSYLNDYAQPQVSSKTNLSGEDQEIVIDCLGYWHWLRLYTYSETGSGDQNLSTKIIAVRDAEPNGSVFSGDNSFITTNTTQVTVYDNSQNTAQSVLRSLNRLGDASFNRYNLGVYENGVLKYEQEPDEIAYKRYLTDNTGIADRLDGSIKPWDVEAGKWLLFPDLLIGRHPPITVDQLKADPRTGLTESVRFRAFPLDVSISGEKLGESDLVLARFGLKGIGV